MLARNELHYQVGRIQELEVALNRNDVGMLETFKSPGLVDETRFGPIQLFLTRWSVGNYPVSIAPCRKVLGKEFFDGYHRIRSGFSQIRDPEAAAPEDPKDPIPVKLEIARER